MVKTLVLVWLVVAAAIGITAALMPSVEIEGGVFALLAVSLLFGLVNAVIGPLLRLLSLPLTLEDVRPVRPRRERRAPCADRRSERQAGGGRVPRRHSRRRADLDLVQRAHFPRRPDEAGSEGVATP